MFRETPNDMMVMMKPIRSILCILFVLTFLISCAEKKTPPQKPAVVSKKISAPVDTTAGAATAADATQTAAADGINQNAVSPKADSVANKDTVAVQDQAGSAPVAATTTEKPADSDVKKHTAELLASVQQEAGQGDRADSYNPKGKPDPFAPLFRDEPKKAAINASAPDASRSKRKKRAPTTPLEKVDLSQLKLVATVRSPNGNAALVEDASGKGFIVKTGTYIGINSGSVVQIAKDRIVVEEETETLLGEISLQKRELKLQKPPGE